METFVAVLHIAVAIILISLVLVQDSKSGSMGGAFGGGGSQSVLGATGAASLAQKMTRWTAVLFALTCILLTVFSNRKSVMDSIPTGPITPPAAEASANAAAVTGTTGIAGTTAVAGGTTAVSGTTAKAPATTTTIAPAKK